MGGRKSHFPFCSCFQRGIYYKVLLLKATKSSSNVGNVFLNFVQLRLDDSGRDLLITDM